MTQTTKKEPWERPVVLRMAAADAEMMNGPFADRRSLNMMNS